MDTLKVIDGFDTLMARGLVEDALRYLDLTAIQAREEGDWATELASYNELIGACRVRGLFDRAWDCAGKAENVIAEARLKDTVAEATTRLNIASLMRATGKPADALVMYSKVDGVYGACGVRDARLAALYNNMCVTAMDLGDSQTALLQGKKAAEVLEREDGSAAELMATYGNLASIYLKLDPPQCVEAARYLDMALDLQERERVDDPHICALVSSKAYLVYMAGNLDDAIVLYEKAMDAIEHYHGHTREYDLMVKNRDKIAGMISN